MTTHQHQHGHHHHGHGTDDVDWQTMGDMLERGGDLTAPSVEQTAAWLRGLLPAAPAPTRILDIGSGPGVAACLLGHAFPEAEVVAVDGAEPLLERARARAAAQGLGDRFRTLHAELPDGLDAVGTADLIYSSRAIHHVGDQQLVLNRLASALRPGGLLAVAEGGLPARFLPRDDAGAGRPGFQARLDVAAEEWFAAMRASLPGSVRTAEHWPALLTGAGLTPAGSRTFLTDLPAPLNQAARAYLHDRLALTRDQFAPSLAADDLQTLDDLIDGDAATGILTRPDAFYLDATTVHTGRR